MTNQSRYHPEAGAQERKKSSISIPWSQALLCDSCFPCASHTSSNTGIIVSFLSHTREQSQHIRTKTKRHRMMFLKWGHHFTSGKKGGNPLTHWPDEDWQHIYNCDVRPASQPAASSQQPASQQPASQRSSRHTAERRDGCSGWISLNVSGAEEKDGKKERKNKRNDSLKRMQNVRGDTWRSWVYRNLCYFWSLCIPTSSLRTGDSRQVFASIYKLIAKIDPNPYEWSQVEGCEWQRGGRRLIKSISHVLKRRTPLLRGYDRIWMSPSKIGLFFPLPNNREKKKWNKME